MMKKKKILISYCRKLILVFQECKNKCAVWSVVSLNKDIKTSAIMIWVLMLEAFVAL